MASTTNQMHSWYQGIHNMSTWGKVFIILGLSLLMVRLYRRRAAQTISEGFTGSPKIVEGPQIYDDFYAGVYDDLTYFQKKNEFEMGAINKSAAVGKGSVVLDIGSGTGHHVAQLKEIGAGNAMGVDRSQSMVNVAQKKYPENKYVLGDAMQRSMFRQNTFSHITMFYFTVYYFQDKASLFANCLAWLKPGGSMIVHVVDREMFDPILPPANPIMMVSPQRYAKTRITTSKVTFNNFKYDANFELSDDKDTASFIEKFTDKTSGKMFRKNKHDMFMEDSDAIEAAALRAGFIIKTKLDMVKAEYEYQYLYVFQKPE